MKSHHALAIGAKVLAKKAAVSVAWGAFNECKR